MSVVDEDTAGTIDSFKYVYTNKQQRCRDGVMNKFLFWCRHPLVPLLFHEVTSLHLSSFRRKDLLFYNWSKQVHCAATSVSSQTASEFVHPSLPGI